MTTRKITALVIMGALIAALSATTAFADYKTTLTLTLKGGSAVSNPTYDETYTLSVPESLRIANTGWNSMGSMTVKYSGSSTGFNTAKKLVVTASSTNNFALVADGGGSISYFLATSDKDSAATTSFTFTAAQITAGASKDLGVNVGSFTGASDGTYTDEITYTVAIQDAGTTASVSDMLTNGAVTVVSATVNGTTSVSGTFTYNGSEFTASNVSGADNAAATIDDNDANNVYFDFIIGDTKYNVTIDTSNKTYASVSTIALTSITVNGTEVFGTLSAID